MNDRRDWNEHPFASSTALRYALQALAQRMDLARANAQIDGIIGAEVAEDRAFADFNVAYFADNDYRGHEVGPHAALKVVEQVEEAGQRVASEISASGCRTIFVRADSSEA